MVFHWSLSDNKSLQVSRTVFWPFSIMLSFGWSPLGRQPPSPPAMLAYIYQLYVDTGYSLDGMRGAMNNRMERERERERERESVSLLSIYVYLSDLCGAYGKGKLYLYIHKRKINNLSVFRYSPPDYPLSNSWFVCCLFLCYVIAGWVI